MHTLWQNMAFWQRLALGVGALVVALGGLLWASRLNNATAGFALGEAPSGAVCSVDAAPAEASAAQVTVAPDPTCAAEARVPSGKIETATFALG